MSKYRPMDYNCLKCDNGRISAGCWTKGEYIKIDGKRKLVSYGFWKMECNSCDYKYKQRV